ncbi:hypothetical protein EVAR_85325_1 [Eumeta japonica]|uniref:DNA2/NAM7 helicase-like C-terminal domain-containing protein n=1 Tax=Eumeta variegata TaxID=151549 RepID=A0A4C2A4I5_EUMVA|nr:hypothetical protein EVAR_85325_1 [Eumeta japonica]
MDCVLVHQRRMQSRGSLPMMEFFSGEQHCTRPDSLRLLPYRPAFIVISLAPSSIRIQRQTASYGRLSGPSASVVIWSKESNYNLKKGKWRKRPSALSSLLIIKVVDIQERSLMERLMEAARATDTSHLVMLRNNYRSHPDILRIPNSLFYNDRLRVSIALY